MSNEFDAAITRKHFCDRVGIHPTTLKRWERAGIMKPKMKKILSIRTATYTENDIQVGRATVRILREKPGQISLHQALKAARRQVSSRTSRPSQPRNQATKRR